MAGRRLWAVVAALLAVSALPVSGAEAPRPQHPTPGVEVRTGAPEPAFAALLRGGDPGAVVRRSAQLLDDAPLAAAGDEAAESYQLAGDLDGDGTRDLLGQRWATRIAALGGADGRELWTRAISHPLSGAAGARLGPDAREGVIVLDHELHPIPGGEAIVLTFTALDGSGQQLWSTRVQGVALRAPTGDEIATVGLPIGLNVADVDGDGATDFRLALLDRVVPAVRGSAVSTVVISGADGGLGDRSAEVAVAGSPGAVPLPDLDGDGQPEMAVLDLAKADTSVTALDGEDASVRWTAGGLDLYSFYVYDEYQVFIATDVFSALGDATGDGTSEIRVLQYDRANRSVFTGVLDGATGQVGFTTDKAVRRLGDVAGDAAAEIAVVGVTRVDGTVTTTYDAVAFGGASRRHTERSMEVGERPRRYAWVEAIGDVDGDGVSDLEHDLLYGSGGDTVRDSVLLSGRTMAELWHPEAGWFSDSFDGAGADHVTVAPDAASVTVTARDGRTGTPLWSTPLGGSGPSHVLPFDLDRDGRSELLVSHACPGPCSGGAGTDVSLLDSDGTVAWYRKR